MTQILDWQAMDDLLSDHLYEFTKINSGMHIALLGTTRGGKTTLATGGTSGQGILSHWEDCLVIDSTGDPGAIKSYGKPVQRLGAIRGHRRLSVSDMNADSRAKIYKYMQRAVTQGHMAIYVDEVRQLADKKFFNLQPILDHIWLFTAKKGISMVGGTQAPRWVPSSFYDQSKAHFIFGMRDKRAMKRLAEISGDVDTLEEVIPNLDRFQFAYVGMDGDVVISKFKAPRNTSTNPPEEPRYKIVNA